MVTLSSASVFFLKIHLFSIARRSTGKSVKVHTSFSYMDPISDFMAHGDHCRRRRAETTTGRILTCSGGGCGRAGGGRRRDDGGVRRAGWPRERRSGGRRGGTGRGSRGRGRRVNGAPCGCERRRR